jgi:hypothetical protein
MVHPTLTALQILRGEWEEGSKHEVLNHGELIQNLQHAERRVRLAFRKETCAVINPLIHLKRSHVGTKQPPAGGKGHTPPHCTSSPSQSSPFPTAAHLDPHQTQIGRHDDVTRAHFHSEEQPHKLVDQCISMTDNRKHVLQEHRTRNVV